MLPDFRLYYKATVVKKFSTGTKTINQHIYSQFTYERQRYTVGKDNHFNVVLGIMDNYIKKNEIRTFSPTIYKNTLKMD